MKEKLIKQIGEIKSFPLPSSWSCRLTINYKFIIEFKEKIDFRDIEENVLNFKEEITSWNFTITKFSPKMEERYNSMILVDSWFDCNIIFIPDSVLVDFLSSHLRLSYFEAKSFSDAWDIFIFYKETNKQISSLLNSKK